MASDVSICNLSLSRLRLNPISSLINPTTREAKECKRNYEPQRDVVLSSHDWGCARQRIALALLDETPAGWDYAYACPGNCLVPRSIYDPAADNGTNVGGSDFSIGRREHIPFEVALSNDGKSKIILTNQEDAVLIYTARISDANLFEPMLVEAIVTKLGAVLAVPLLKDKAMSTSLLKECMFWLAQAAQIDANAGARNQSDSGDLVRARS